MLEWREASAELCRSRNAGGALLCCFTKLSLTSVIRQYALLSFSYTCSGCCYTKSIWAAEECAGSGPELIR